MDSKDITYTGTEIKEEMEEKKKPKTFNFIGCKNCGKTNTTLIKATDSYYCKNCFNELGKKKFNKKGNK